MKEIVYKLTDEDGWTRKGQHNGLKWGVGVSHEAKGIGGLCTDGCIHAYTSPYLAVFLNPIHANISNPRLFEGEMKVTDRDKSDLKVGGKRLTLTKELSLPKPSIRQTVCFAILSAKAAFGLIDTSYLSARRAKIYTTKVAEWNVWADNYLEGKKNSAAYAYADAAADAANAARSAAADAANAARSATYAAAAADAANAARSATYAAYAATYAAYAYAYAATNAANAANAAYAAYAAYARPNKIDLAKIAEEAMGY